MKHQICRTVLAAAAVTAGVFLSACGLFRDPADSVFDDAEDAIATDRAASDIESAEFSYQFGDGRTASIRWPALTPSRAAKSHTPPLRRRRARHRCCPRNGRLPSPRPP